MQIRKILLVAFFVITMYSIGWIRLNVGTMSEILHYTLLSRWFPTSQLIGTQLIGVNKLRVN